MCHIESPTVVRIFFGPKFCQRNLFPKKSMMVLLLYVPPYTYNLCTGFLEREPNISRPKKKKKCAHFPTREKTRKSFFVTPHHIPTEQKTLQKHPPSLLTPFDIFRDSAFFLLRHFLSHTFTTTIWVPFNHPTFT